MHCLASRLQQQGERRQSSQQPGACESRASTPRGAQSGAWIACASHAFGHLSALHLLSMPLCPWRPLWPVGASSMGIRPRHSTHPPPTLATPPPLCFWESANRCCRAESCLAHRVRSPVPGACPMRSVGFEGSPRNVRQCPRPAGWTCGTSETVGESKA